MKNISFLIITMLLLSCRSVKPPKLIFYQDIRHEELIKAEPKVSASIYIIQNYSSSVRIEKMIDSLAYAIGNGKQDNQYILQLYKESSKTNLINLKKNPRDLDRYSDVQDHLFDYVWYNKKFIGKQKFRNGQIISDKNVKLSPPPKEK